MKKIRTTCKWFLGIVGFNFTYFLVVPMWESKNQYLQTVLLISIVGTQRRTIKINTAPSELK